MDLDLLDSLPEDSIGFLIANADWNGAAARTKATLEEEFPLAAAGFAMGFDQLEGELRLPLSQVVLPTLKGPVATALVSIPYRLPERSSRNELNGFFRGMSRLELLR